MLVRDPRRRITAHQVLLRRGSTRRAHTLCSPKPDEAVLSHEQAQENGYKKSLCEEEIAGLREMFKAIDSDSSGYITFDELKNGLRRYGANLKESEIYDLMKAADIDNNGAIDYGEFIAATLHLSKIDKDYRLLRAFSYFDKDGSCYITQASKSL